MNQIDRESHPKPSYRLHSISGLETAALLGGVAPTSLMLSMNYHRLGFSTQRNIAATIGVLAAVLQIVSFIFWFVLKDVSYVNLPLNLIMYFFVKKLVARDIEFHQEDGGEFISSWFTSGWALSYSLVLIYLVLPLLPFAVPEKKPQKPSPATITVFDNDTICHSMSISQDDVNRLANTLKIIGYFKNQNSVVLLFDYPKPYRLAFRVKRESWESQEDQERHHDLAKQLVALCALRIREVIFMSESSKIFDKLSFG